MVHCLKKEMGTEAEADLMGQYKAILRARGVLTRSFSKRKVSPNDENDKKEHEQLKLQADLALSLLCIKMRHLEEANYHVESIWLRVNDSINSKDPGTVAADQLVAPLQRIIACLNMQRFIRDEYENIMNSSDKKSKAAALDDRLKCTLPEEELVPVERFLVLAVPVEGFFRAYPKVDADDFPHDCEEVTGQSFTRYRILIDSAKEEESRSQWSGMVIGSIDRARLLFQTERILFFLAVKSGDEKIRAAWSDMMRAVGRLIDELAPYTLLGGLESVILSGRWFGPKGPTAFSEIKNLFELIKKWGLVVPPALPVLSNTEESAKEELLAKLGFVDQEFPQLATSGPLLDRREEVECHWNEVSAAKKRLEESIAGKSTSVDVHRVFFQAEVVLYFLSLKVNVLEKALEHLNKVTSQMGRMFQWLEPNEASWKEIQGMLTQIEELRGQIRGAVVA
jgi:hypothetical protein